MDLQSKIDPVAFTQMSEKEKNRAILDLIVFDWNLNWIKEQFGEIPDGINYDQNILQVLNDIQSENSPYFIIETDTGLLINRRKRNDQADYGMPLINGLPVSNLSEGEQLSLCVDIAISKPNGLQIILIDGTEKLSAENRENLYRKCRDKGIQFIATRTTDSSEMEINYL